jgi:CheY-like chemotaxis protein
MSDTVLLADASQTIRALARLTLSSEPVQLVTAASGQQALELLRAERPGVVIADVRLPDIDGYQLCRLVRERDPQVRFVLLTPEYLPVDEALAAEVGVSATLQKPFERRSLLAALRGGGAPIPPPPVAPAPLPARPSAAPLPAEPAPAPAAPPAPPSAAELSEAVTAALPDVVARLLPAALDAALPALVERALARLLDDALRAALKERLPGGGAEMRSLVEPVVWKTVPALAEQLIKEEIARLTEEAE